MKYLVVQTFWYYEQNTGEFYYRIRKPGEALSALPHYEVRNVHIQHPLFADLALKADLLIAHLIPNPEMETIIRLRRAAGKPTVFEIADNYMKLGPWIDANDGFRNPKIRQGFLHFAAQSDLLQVSTPEVGRVLGFVNPKLAVFENQITRTYCGPKPDDGSFHFGWGGSTGHEIDLAWIQPVVLRFLEHHPQAHFHFMGHWPIFQKYYEPLAHARIHYTPPGPIEDYYRFLENLHVGLAPLKETDFNRGRSDIKFLEYAAHGAVPLLSDAVPYAQHAVHEDNALKFKDLDGLYAVLSRLYADPELRKAQAARAFDYVRRERTYETHALQRDRIYRSLLHHPPLVVDVPELPDCTGLCGQLRLVVDAFISNQMELAEQKVSHLCRIFPNYHLAHVWRAKIWTQMGRYQQVLDTFLELAVHPIYRDLLTECLYVAARCLAHPLTERLLNAIEDPALRLLLSPQYALEPEQSMRRLLAWNPFHYQSLTGLAALLMAQNRELQSAKDLLRLAIFMHDENAALKQRLAQLAQMLADQETKL